MKKIIIKELRRFIESFKKMDRRFFQATMYSVLFLFTNLIFVGILRTFLNGKTEKLMEMGLIDPSSAGNLLVAGDVAVASARSIYVSTITSIIITGIIILLSYIFFSFMTWSCITKKKTDFKLIKKYLYLMPLWVAGSIGIFFLIGSGMTQQTILRWVLIFILLYTHLTNIMNISYFKNKKPGKAASEAFSIGLGKIKIFIIPYLFATVVFYIINLTISPLVFISQGVLYGAISVAMVIYLTWLKSYTNMVVNNI